ncbi:MAG: hypothetical protein M3145_00700, partial [Pseudomonadota bacterium]|nr:hypothetical protein [Pseudomonadota bacterium]
MTFRNFGRAILHACVGAVLQHPWRVLGVGLVLTVVAGLAATRLEMNTDPDALLGEDLRFVQIARDYKRAFPQDSERILVVVDAPTADRAEAAASRLAEALRARPQIFAHVEVPGSDPFFRRHALLFLGLDRLNALST